MTEKAFAVLGVASAVVAVGILSLVLGSVLVKGFSQLSLSFFTEPRPLFGQEGGATGVDDDFAARGFENIGAWILGRNMFGPVRGPWPNEDWKGWWGGNPPYRVPVFVLTHHARKSFTMEGSTTFQFVTDGIHKALERAKAAAKGLDVRLGGGAATIRQYLQAGLVDEMHFAQSPVLLGSGESLFAGLDLPALGYRCTESVAGERATHYRIARA